jgi:hypothetical protein
MSLNLTDDEIHGLIDYARDKFAAERYPFAPALKAIRETLAKLDPKPKPQPPAPKKPYVRALCSIRGKRRRRSSLADSGSMRSLLRGFLWLGRCGA